VNNDNYPINPFWRLADSFTPQQAAALIGGADPHSVSQQCDYFHNGEGWRELKGIEPVRTVWHIVLNAITSQTLKADVRYIVLDKREIDWNSTTIARKDLIKWLKSRGMKTGFFFPNATLKTSDTFNCLNPKHPHYSPKLAAAIKAWEALANIQITGKHPKQALSAWLVQNATRLELINSNGKINREGIDEIAKIANWKKTGGAPKSKARMTPKTDQTNTHKE